MALFFKIVPEYQRAIRFTLGRFDGAVRGPGWVWVIPFVHQIRMVDLREEVVIIPPQTCITKDNAPVTIDLLVFMRVLDASDAVIKVQSYHAAAQGIATTTLRAMVGDMTLDDILAKREHINTQMQGRLDEVTERWGVKVNAVEIKDVLPPTEIQSAMSRQMSAERTRRAVVTEAGGNRQAEIVNAEGTQQAAILNAEGAKQATILVAEGNKQAVVLNAEGFAQALQTIYQVAQGIDERTMTLRYLDMLRSLGSSDSATWVVPMDLTSLARGLARDIAGANGAQPAGDGHEPSA